MTDQLRQDLLYLAEQVIYDTNCCYNTLYSKLGLNAVPRNTQGLMIDPQQSSFHLLCETVELLCYIFTCVHASVLAVLEI